MMLVALLLALLSGAPDRPVTLTGRVISQDGPAISLPFSPKGGRLNYPLVARSERQRRSLQDVADLPVDVTVTGMLIEHNYKMILIVESIKL